MPTPKALLCIFSALALVSILSISLMALNYNAVYSINEYEQKQDSLSLNADIVLNIPITEYSNLTTTYHHSPITITFFMEIAAFMQLNNHELNQILNETGKGQNIILTVMDSYTINTWFDMWWHRFTLAMKYPYNEKQDTMYKFNKITLFLIPLSHTALTQLINKNLSSNDFNIFIPKLPDPFVSFIENNDTNLDEFIMKSHIWYFRMYIVNHILLKSNGINSLVLSDMDAIWIKNPYIFMHHMDKQYDVDIVGGNGVWPYGKKCALLPTNFTHNKIVLGFLYIKYSRKIKEFAYDLRKYIIHKYEHNATMLEEFELLYDDQVCFNCYIAEKYRLDSLIDRDPLFHLKFMDKNKTDGDGLRMILLSRATIPRFAKMSRDCVIIAHINFKKNKPKYPDTWGYIDYNYTKDGELFVPQRRDMFGNSYPLRSKWKTPT